MTSVSANSASRRPRFSQINDLWPWLCAASVALSLLMLGALLTLLLVRGLGHFWPASLEEVTLSSGETFAGQAVREVALPQQTGDERLYFTGNQDIDGARWRWVTIEQIVERAQPADLIRIDRSPWGDFIGRLEAIEQGDQRWEGEAAWQQLTALLALPANQRQAGQLLLTSVDGHTLRQPLASVVSAQAPNAMSGWQKARAWGEGVWRFLSEGPRAANTGGGVWPAIFGTVLMVILMSVMVTPFGVLAAIYLNEIAHQGRLTRLVRIGVRNLAGVPSIVYGVFGLGVFVYGIGGSLDEWFFSDTLPSPTFGTGGLLWASLTLALLTLPVVIVATEEGLARIPEAQREGAVALGATRLEMLTRIVLPMAAPAMLTGVILAVARAAGEVAPLMLVGVAKLAPQMPIDGEFPYLHLERKFMHLGYHLFDTAFHGEDVQAAIPLVYATALLLVLIVLMLNLTAIFLRHYLSRQRGNEC
ncbi:phosphate ABC transporter permease PstA [Halomonas sp. ISL-60]|uniref:phosphate ABC transporter permease PstA n=1 Tax=unclassified Halomonas TaxID=2609666 RepID=UPI0007D9324E|nr:MULTISPECIES: phosphate ABC transporter permease PstA [unclassified Halomonas]MBT2772270.1 phosphate ABC transporter permease PstA [Halomonas sp. ISL-60]MBT2789074.1 phosphate ABC transporter permease PstA [Halomonas sp. ISL-106]MBT2799692.1 phosphate ABC transporter permease PstA [Halomonas sp. ISL-104]MBT2800707.1 phosphate ABC transporter permease PstA [Halomonas sp. ISL-56]OAL60199.1 phosphate ABC transporter, permease protein PstA [Halomonas sp. ALS9]